MEQQSKIEMQALPLKGANATNSQLVLNPNIDFQQNHFNSEITEANGALLLSPGHL